MVPIKLGADSGIYYCCYHQHLGWVLYYENKAITLASEQGQELIKNTPFVYQYLKGLK